MTAAPSHDRAPGHRSLAEGASPAAVREALLPEDREVFDQAYRDALDLAREAYDLSPVHETLEVWRRQAIAQSDPEAFRRMVRRAAEFFTGRPVPDEEPFAVTRAKAGV